MLVQRHILSMSWLSSASAEEKFLLYNLITIFAQSPTTLNTAILFLIKFGSHLRFRLPLLPLCSQDRQYIIFDQILLVWQILSILLSFSLVSRFLQNKWVNFRDEKVKCTLSLAIGILSWFLKNAKQVCVENLSEICLTPTNDPMPSINKYTKPKNTMMASEDPSALNNLNAKGGRL